MSSKAPDSGVRETLANVLIVEDDIDSAEVLRLSLAHAGYATRAALNAAAAVAIVEQGFLPDYAVVDIGLPEVSGLELIVTLRAKPGLEHCRFVAVSGYVLSGLPERSVALGFDVHLTKPIDFDALLATFAREGARLRSG